MKALIVALLLIATVPATAQRRSSGITAEPLTTAPGTNPMHFGTSRTIDLYDTDKTTVIARATISSWGIFLRDLEGKHFATIARNKDGTVGAFDPHGKPMDPSVLPSMK